MFSYLCYKIFSIYARILYFYCKIYIISYLLSILPSILDDSKRQLNSSTFLVVQILEQILQVYCSLWWVLCDAIYYCKNYTETIPFNIIIYLFHGVTLLAMYPGLDSDINHMNNKDNHTYIVGSCFVVSINKYIFSLMEYA